mgnify:FL=1
MRKIKKDDEEIDGHYFKIIKKINKKITARYDKIKDWKMDPAGYFLIRLNREKKMLEVAYCVLSKKKNSKNNQMKAVIKGRTAIEVVNTLIREKFISTLQHAADMGIELNKAEIALNYQLEYIQDKDLKIKIRKK